jgi:hypothetical protein
VSYINQTAWSSSILRVDRHAVDGNQLHGPRHSVEHILKVENGVSDGVGNPPELHCSGVHPQNGWSEVVGISFKLRRCVVSKNTALDLDRIHRR